LLAPVEVCGKFSLDEFDQQRLNPSVKAPLKIDLHVGQQLVLKYVFSGYNLNAIIARLT